MQLSENENQRKPHPDFQQEGKPSNFVLSYILLREARKTAEKGRFSAFLHGMRRPLDPAAPRG
jgi:hypothetical protein